MKWNSEVVCPKCKGSAALRINRASFLQRRVLGLFGIFPWKCGACGSTFLWPRRGNRDSTNLMLTGTIDISGKS